MARQDAGVFAVLGMSVSFLVYIIFGQYFGSYQLGQLAGRPIFSIHGYEPGLQNWAYYMLLPVLISVIVSMGYNTRFYRAVMVEETTQDYITTAGPRGDDLKDYVCAHVAQRDDPDRHTHHDHAAVVGDGLDLVGALLRHSWHGRDTAQRD